MTRHVSAERLARFRDADLGPAAARRVEAHLAGCAACRAQADALAQLPGLLASARVPPIPAHLAARIENALTTESAQRAAAAAAAAAADRPAARRAEAERGLAQPRRGMRGPAGRLVAAAAVAVVAVGLGGYYALGRPPSQNAASSASSAGRPAARAPAASGSLHQEAPAAGEAEPRASAGPVLGPVQRYTSGSHAGTFTPVRSATDYLPAQLGRQAAATIATVRAARPPSTPVAPGVVNPAPTQLAGCVGRIAAGHAVLLVDLARYQGTAATVIVTGPPATEQAWVVGAACSATSSDVLAHQAVP